MKAVAYFSKVEADRLVVVWRWRGRKGACFGRRRRDCVEGGRILGVEADRLVVVGDGAVVMVLGSIGVARDC